MATTNTNLTKMKIAEQMIPSIYQGDDDLEEFIQDSKRYFELCGLDEGNQSMMVKCLIRRDLLPIYEAVQDRGQKFDERMREAFQKPTSLIGDFLEIYNYEKNTDSATIYFEKVEKYVKKLMQHRWNEEELVSYFLIHCLKDKDTKREIRMREATKIDEIKSIIKKIDAINVEVSGIAAVQRKETFANVVKKREEFANLQQYKARRPESFNDRSQYVERRERNDFHENRFIQKPITMNCWNCQEIGHSSRDCPRRRRQTCFNCRREGHISRFCPDNVPKQRFCWACKEDGHTRDECPNISCSSCRKKGHLKFQCRNEGRNLQQNSWKQPYYARAGRSDNRYRVAAMMSEEDNIREKSRNDAMTRDTQDDEIRERTRYADDDDDDVMPNQYPKARASTLGEMIGAMQ